MKIAIEMSPLTKGNFLQHRVRGTGFYIENLKKSLLQYFPGNKYIFFTRGEKLPKDTDLVHYPYFEPFFLTLPIYKKYKTIITVHDLTPLVFPKFFPRGIKGELKWQLQKAALRRADAIITDSVSSKKDILRHTGIFEDKISVVYLAAGEEFKKLEIGNWNLEIKKKYDLPDRFILYVGDATWNKNLPRLIEVAKNVKIPLVMVGKALVDRDFDKDNPWNQDLVRVEKLIGKDKNILRLGFIPAGDLAMIYNLATVFVMPSLYEGFGLPILEAMNCGCPVVTTKAGSIPEVAGNATFYVNANNFESIAEGLKTMYENKELREKYSEKGLIQAKKFSWKKTAEGTFNVYKKVVMGTTI